MYNGNNVSSLAVHRIKSHCSLFITHYTLFINSLKIADI